MLAWRRQWYRRMVNGKSIAAVSVVFVVALWYCVVVELALPLGVGLNWPDGIGTADG